MPSAWKSYMLQFQLPPQDVALGGRSPKFEQVSNDHHQMSLARGQVLRSDVGEIGP